MPPQIWNQRGRENGILNLPIGELMDAMGPAGSHDLGHLRPADRLLPDTSPAIELAKHRATADLGRLAPGQHTLSSQVIHITVLVLPGFARMNRHAALATEILIRELQQLT